MIISFHSTGKQTSAGVELDDKKTLKRYSFCIILLAIIFKNPIRGILLLCYVLVCLLLIDLYKRSLRVKRDISRTHSFLRTILPNSAVQLAKFRGSPWQNCPNSTAYRRIPFVRKISFILSKILHILKAGMALSYASNIQRKLSIFFLFKSAICQLVALCLFTIVPHYDGNY